MDGWMDGLTRCWGGIEVRLVTLDGVNFTLVTHCALHHSIELSFSGSALTITYFYNGE